MSCDCVWGEREKEGRRGVRVGDQVGLGGIGVLRHVFHTYCVSVPQAACALLLIGYMLSALEHGDGNKEVETSGVRFSFVMQKGYILDFNLRFG